MREFSLDIVQPLEGRTIEKIVYAENCDEGFLIIFTDGSTLNFGFSGCEGIVDVHIEKTSKQATGKCVDCRFFERIGENSYGRCSGVVTQEILGGEESYKYCGFDKDTKFCMVGDDMSCENEFLVLEDFGCRRFEEK